MSDETKDTIRGLRAALRQMALMRDYVQTRLAEVEAERDRLLSEVNRLLAERNGEVWFWNGDGSDDPESLSCPVLMTADQVRALTDEVERLRAAGGAK